MDPGAIEAMIAAIGVQVANATAALVPVGVGITLSFIVLGIVLIGANLMTGSSFMPQLVRFTGVAAGTMWAITEWPNIAKQTLDAARAATALLVPGYAGPTGLFTVATDISGRLIVEGSSWSWSAPLTSMADAVMLGLAPFLIEFGLAITGLLAALAEIELLLGSAMRPAHSAGDCIWPNGPAWLWCGQLSGLGCGTGDRPGRHIACHGAGGDGHDCCRWYRHGANAPADHGAVPVGHSLCCRWRLDQRDCAIPGWRWGWKSRPRVGANHDQCRSWGCQHGQLIGRGSGQRVGRCTWR